jgi:hypothetical protein
MEFFDNENKMEHIQEQLRRTEAFFNAFKTEFTTTLFETLNGYYPVSDNDSEVENLMDIFATQIFNSTESVIDKDLTYPEYRLVEELDVMRIIVSKIPEFDQINDFSETIHQKAKELIVHYFEATVELSANGFRLLELNSKLQAREFLSNLRTHLISKNQEYQFLFESKNEKEAHN